ncbi:MAG TPA: hypothetical protein VK970_23075, partial [Candidatus Methylacidiphilales bacterium]|nr:hypothetical protein [Candidatus Methylacidiphilales bacterium]
HGIVFERSGKRYEILLSFECGKLYATCDGKMLGMQRPQHRDDQWFFSGNSQKLDSLLDAAKIPREKAP